MNEPLPSRLRTSANAIVPGTFPPNELAYALPETLLEAADEIDRPGWFAIAALAALTLGCWIHEHRYQRRLRQRGRR